MAGEQRGADEQREHAGGERSARRGAEQVAEQQPVEPDGHVGRQREHRAEAERGRHDDADGDL